IFNSSGLSGQKLRTNFSLHGRGRLNLWTGFENAMWQRRNPRTALPSRTRSVKLLRLEVSTATNVVILYEFPVLRA
ncbi:MAG: hypothetical protein Q4E59_04565, partial [Bacteroidales bacterium]|nr:hypothetical protein [Bacteroidales bacterium]